MNQMIKTAAIITARGGSKRLPRKNVKLFCGHPLVAWAITQAKNSELIDRVYVTTDDDEIEKISKQYGAEIIRRPNWPDADKAAANRPVLHAIGKIMEEHPELETIITMLPTCPLQKPEDLDNGIRKYRQIGADRLSQIIPQRETVVYRITSPCVARLVIFDKKYHYGILPGGWLITSPNWYIAYNLGMPSDLDSDLDLPENWPQIETYYVTAEYWQYADTDTLEEFEFGEKIMEYYILKGQGISVYKNYFKEWTTKREKEKELQVSKSMEEKAVEQLTRMGVSTDEIHL